MKYIIIFTIFVVSCYCGVIEDHISSEVNKERHHNYRPAEVESVDQSKSISKRSVPSYVYGTFVRVVEKMKNYPYNHYSYFSRQDDVSPTLFTRIVGFFKKGIRTMLNGYDQIRRQGFTGVSTQAFAGIVGLGAVAASQRETIGNIIANMIEYLGPESQEVVATAAEVVPIPVNGGVSEWGDWEAWTACTATCYPGGTQTETRSRTCTNPEPKNGGADCSESLSESNSQSCNTGYCFTCTADCGECTSSSTCDAGAGDCDSDDQCTGALTCEFNKPNEKCTGCNSNTCPSGRDCCG